jgi:hypothetical protein
VYIIAVYDAGSRFTVLFFAKSFFVTFMTSQNQTGLPNAKALAQAIEMYLARAYPNGPAAGIAEKFSVPDDAELADWLMESVGEPEPAGADITSVRSIALRLGNAFYPNMKLRLTRPPGNNPFLLMADSHDVMLVVPESSPDYAAVEELKSANAALVSDITNAWDSAGLPTERNYLRDKIRQARKRGD